MSEPRGTGAVPPEPGVEGGGPGETGGLPRAEADGTPVRRPLIERVGLFLVALVMAALFGAVALALVSGGELFLGVMAALGCAMTIWVGGLTLIRG